MNNKLHIRLFSYFIPSQVEISYIMLPLLLFLENNCLIDIYLLQLEDASIQYHFYSGIGSQQISPCKCQMDQIKVIANQPHQMGRKIDCTVQHRCKSHLPELSSFHRFSNCKGISATAKVLNESTQICTIIKITVQTETVQSNLAN